jgi:prevent-host-death family protein
MITMTVNEAMAALPDLLTRVEGGEKVTITRHGHAVAVLMPPDALRGRRATVASGNAERIHDLLAHAKATAPARAWTDRQPCRATGLRGQVGA